jgi:hypothetical protein
MWWGVSGCWIGELGGAVAAVHCDVVLGSNSTRRAEKVAKRPKQGF